MGLLLPVLLLVAWALRLYRAGRQSLSADEIATLQAAQSPDLAAFLQSHAGLDHPPLHFLFERIWVAIAGASEFALRFPSALAGFLGVVLLFQVGRQAGGPRLGAVAVLLAVCSPFGAFFGQEARGYTFMLLSLTCCLWLALRLARGAAGRWWVLWGVAAGLTALTMYVAIPALAAIVLYLTWVTRRQQRWAAWRGCVLAGGLLFGAWAAYANPLASVYDTAGDLTPRADLLAVLTRGLGAPVAGAYLPEPWIWVVSLPFLALLLAGAVLAPAAHRRLFGGSLVVCIAVVSLAAVDRLGFHPRYLLPALPAAYLLAARGITAIRRYSRIAAVGACLLVVLPMLWAVRNVYFDARYARTDFKTAAALVAQQHRPGDVVVFNAPWAKVPFEYYAGRTFVSVGLPQDTPPAAPETQQQLQALTESHQRIWLIRWQDWFTDPQRSIRGWLDERLPRVVDAQLNYITVEGYLARSPERAAGDVRALPHLADFAGKVRLAAATLDTSGVEQQRRLTVSLQWLSMGPTHSQPYKVFVHLVDGRGRLVAQQDGEPVLGRLPTTKWRPDMLVVDEHDIMLPDSLADGSYRVIVGLYQEDDPRLQVVGSGSDHVQVAANLRLRP